MRKKLLCLLLVLSLMLSLIPTALAAGDDVRETDFFTDQPHADVDFADMEYRHIDSAPILAEMDEIRKLLSDGANEKKVEEAFNKFTDQFLEALTMYQLLEIRTYQDVTDTEAAEELEYANELCMTVTDALILLIQDILSSPCGRFLRSQLTSADIVYYTEYEAMTDEQLTRSNQETALQSEYLSAAYQTYTAEYEGREWDNASLLQALAAGEVDQEAYTAISRAIAKNQNAAMGDIYLRMVALRDKTAADAGYDNFGDYAYAEIYQRDYTQQEIRSFHQAVKEYIVPLYNELYPLYSYESDDPAFFRDYTDDAALDLIEPYLGRLSGELAEAFAYMRGHGLYDSGYSDVKGDAGFTVLLSSYGAPFYFNAPSGNFYDLSTAIHEFGHYNNFYWQAAGWNDGVKSVDVSEVHSQALELFFTRFYEEIFSSADSARAVEDYLMLDLLSGAVINGCLYDELQQYVYAADDLTLEQINQEFCRLCREYGLIEEDDERTEMYGWSQVPHTFTSPFYYISYAVSAAGALAFWLDAQEDYFAAVDNYLEFTALDADYGFQESFSQVGMESPISAAYVRDLADTLREELDLEARLADLEAQLAGPADLLGSEWFAHAASMLYSAGVIGTDDDGRLRPYDPALWDDAADLVERLTLQRPDVEDGEAVITRVEFARLLARGMGLKDSADTPFSDTDDGAVAALAEAGALSGYADGTFRPDQPMLRAEMWSAAYQLLMGMVERIMGGFAA